MKRRMAGKDVAILLVLMIIRNLLGTVPVWAEAASEETPVLDETAEEALEPGADETAEDASEADETAEDVSETEGELTEEAMAEEAPSLWKTAISMKTVDLPKGKLKEGEQIRAMSPDGTKVFVDNRDDGPALLNLETGKFTLIHLSDWTREGIVSSPVPPGKAGAEPEKMKDKELLAYTLTDRNPKAYFSASYASCLGGPFLGLMDFFGRSWILDCDTTLLYGPFVSVPSIFENQVLEYQTPNTLTKTDLVTGKKTPVELDLSGEIKEAGLHITGACFTPESGVCVVASVGAMDIEKGDEYFLFCQNPGEELQTISLGVYPFGKNPREIVSAGNGRYLIYNRSVITITPVLLADTASGTVRMISVEDEELVFSDLSEKDPIGLSGFVYLMNMADGRVLIQIMNSGLLCLLDVETEEVEPLRGLFRKKFYAPYMLSITGNGYDRFFYRSMMGDEGVQSYTEIVPLG